MQNLNNTTIVLLANTFNVAIFKQNWLLENNILEKDEFSSNDIFTPMAVNIPSNNFDLLIVPDRLQLSVKSNFELMPDLSNRVVGGITKLLPHSPYTALGFNFNYILAASDHADFFTKSKELLVCENNPLSSLFTTDDSRFGAYFSKDLKDFNDARLRLDIKPIRHEDQEMLALNFNVNYNTNNSGKIISFINDWSNIYSFVDGIAKTISDKF